VQRDRGRDRRNMVAISRLKGLKWESRISMRHGDMKIVNAELQVFLAFNKKGS
jgi:hypothetical protein